MSVDGQRLEYCLVVSWLATPCAPYHVPHLIRTPVQRDNLARGLVREGVKGIRLYDAVEAMGCTRHGWCQTSEANIEVENEGN